MSKGGSMGSQASRPTALTQSNVFNRGQQGGFMAQITPQQSPPQYPTQNPQQPRPTGFFPQQQPQMHPSVIPFNNRPQQGGWQGNPGFMPPPAPRNYTPQRPISIQDIFGRWNQQQPQMGIGDFMQRQINAKPGLQVDPVPQQMGIGDFMQRQINPNVRPFPGGLLY